MINMKFFLKLTLLFVILSSALQVHAQEKKLRRVTFLPQWFPQAQFAGYYVAYEKGFYRNRGIDLVIMTGGSEKQTSDYLRRGKADFATMWLSTALQCRDRGIPVVNIAQVIQQSSQMLVARKSKGIRTVRDLDNRTIGVFPGDFTILPRALAKKYRLNLRFVPLERSVNIFFWDGVDVTSACWYNEYHTILDSGLNPDELNLFFFSKLGLDFPEDGLYCLSNFFDRDPGLCGDFARASLDGWEYAFRHPEEALDIVMRYVAKANVGSNRVHQKWMLEQMQDLIQPPGEKKRTGVLERADYLLVAEELKKEGIIKRYPDFESFFKENASQGRDN